MPKKEVVIKNVTILAAYLLVIWGFYRFLFKLPEEVEELFIKPLLWLTPVIYLVRKERSGISSLGISSKNLFPSLYISLAIFWWDLNLQGTLILLLLTTIFGIGSAFVFARTKNVASSILLHFLL